MLLTCPITTQAGGGSLNFLPFERLLSQTLRHQIFANT